MVRTVPQTAEDTQEEIDTPEDLAAAAEVGFDRVPRTPLGRSLMAARREFLAANGRFLTDEELEREIAERRGGVYGNEASDEDVPERSIAHRGPARRIER